MEQDPAGLRTNPAKFLEGTIRAYVLGSPLNRLKDIDGSPIYDEPLVGFADGDDPLFQEYKTIIGDFHLTPRDVLDGRLAEAGAEMRPGPAGQGVAGGAPPSLNPHMEPSPAGREGRISVISIVFPMARSVRTSNRKMTQGPSLKWNNARWQGAPLADEVTRHVASILRERGFRAAAPDQAASFQVIDLPNGRCSNWSQRHAAYAAGLGTFGLSDVFITPKGAAAWCTSLVTDLELPPTAREYAGHLANCPFFVDGSCGACIKRCPAGAISPQGHDKIKCREELYVGQKAWLDKPGYMGRYAGCGLCLTRVPCEERIPARALKVLPR